MIPRIPNRFLLSVVLANLLLGCTAAPSATTQPLTTQPAEAAAQPGCCCCATPCAPVEPTEQGEQLMSDATPESVNATQPASTKPPFMFKEAKLPPGFPPPGPVDQIVVKQYPGYRAARTTAPAGARDPSSAMFNPLFQHIKKNQVKMTAPVEMTYDPAAVKTAEKPEPINMAFLYERPDQGSVGSDGKIEVLDLPAVTVLSITVRGNYNARTFSAGLAKLQEYLDAHPEQFMVAGPPRYLGYNSPMVPWFLRVGEVQIPVTSK